MNVGTLAMSVVVPTIGRVDALRGCLQALAASDYARDRFEVLVANDGGGPPVETLVGEFADRLRTRTVTPARTGPSAARNAGAAAAHGRYVAFTDDDCEPSSSWLVSLERSLTTNPGAAVGGEVRNGAPGDLGAVASQIVVDALHDHWNRDLAAPRFFASSNVAFPLDEFLQIGGFDEDFRYAEDRELCERWIRTGHRFARAPDAYVVHMRELPLRSFVRQHHGYGRGAYNFHRRWSGDVRSPQTTGVISQIARQTAHSGTGHARVAVGAYAAISQVATATGFAREALTRRRRDG
jgi:glycosyltransferase involved in cell wall biosynthesis